MLLEASLVRMMQTALETFELPVLLAHTFSEIGGRGGGTNTIPFGALDELLSAVNAGFLGCLGLGLRLSVFLGCWDCQGWVAENLRLECRINPITKHPQFSRSLATYKISRRNLSPR